ncbi:hypothetical protein Pla110_03010 [Polystyrenella longa]|uniref:Uncharacterized protein n=1 Tax=Polystyrenella longa TaxID=2528007 RepID=A0A518CH95_9PLAN|nr:hypothetical protein [Polystyrenella longa]QDU78597.1 hypothetical protein Pla110_03010 [Polystyrenella longa]
MMRRRWQAITTLLLMTMIPALSLTGCASFQLAQAMKFDLNKPFPWETDDDEIRSPERLVAVWKDTIMNQRSQKGVRGFGGRVMFYDSQGAKPIRVAGDVVIYAFDNTGVDADAIPDRKFVFKADRLEEHYSKSALGHSYSFWLPWEEIGGEPRKISLLVRFEGEAGETVMSDPAMQSLPGIPKGFMLGKKQDEEKAAAAGGIQQASYEETESALKKQNAEPLRMQTETIEVPKRFIDKHLTDPQAEWDIPVDNSGESSLYFPQPGAKSTSSRAPQELDRFEAGELPAQVDQKMPVERTSQYRPEPQLNAQDLEIQELRASLDVMRQQLAKTEQRQQSQTTNSAYKGWDRKSERQIPLNSGSGRSAEVQGTLRARYEQYLRQAQTSEVGNTTVAVGHPAPDREASPARLQTIPRSREQQTEWDWQTPESVSGSPPSK